MDNNYLNFRKKNENETELYIYGPIKEKTWIDDWFGEGKDKIGAFTLKEALKRVDTPNLTVRINSYGGNVADGLAIYSLLSEFEGHLKTIVDGFACSAASVIFMAGEERIVPENGLLMIHNAWAEVRGDSNTMQKASEDLVKITQPSLNIYTKKTKLSEKELKEMMDREEWITSQEAYEWGFSTSQERKEEYKQALEADFVHGLVIKNKELQKQVKELKESTLEEKSITKDKELIQTIQEAVEKSTEQALIQMHKNIEDTIRNDTEEPKGLINEDSWESFFNTKK